MLHMGVMPHMTAMPHMLVMPHVTVMPHMTVMPHVTVMPHMTVMPRMIVIAHMDIMPHMIAMPHVIIIPSYGCHASCDCHPLIWVSCLVRCHATDSEWPTHKRGISASYCMCTKHKRIALFLAFEKAFREVSGHRGSMHAQNEHNIDVNNTRESMI